MRIIALVLLLHLFGLSSCSELNVEGDCDAKALADDLGLFQTSAVHSRRSDSHPAGDDMVIEVAKDGALLEDDIEFFQANVVKIQSDERSSPQVEQDKVAAVLTEAQAPSSADAAPLAAAASTEKGDHHSVSNTSAATVATPAVVVSAVPVPIALASPAEGGESNEDNGIGSLLDPRAGVQPFDDASSSAGAAKEGLAASPDASSNGTEQEAMADISPIAELQTDPIDHGPAKTALHRYLMAHGSWGVAPPVSTPVKCIVVLALQYVAVYGLLVLCRTTTQFHGTQRSTAEEVLQSTATLTVNMLPTMAVLFLGVEMLAGELSKVSSIEAGRLVPWWADVAMVVAVVSSLAVTFCHILQLACLGSGERFLMMLHLAASVVQYASVAVVIMAALTMDVIYSMWLGGSNLGISPAVQCVIMLTVMHFAILLLLKFCQAVDANRFRGYAGERGLPIGPASNMTKAAKLAARTQILAPMLGLLFLGTRLQTTQVESTGDWWQCQLFFYVCSYAMLGKAISCLPLIFLGRMGSGEAAMMQMHHFGPWRNTPNASAGAYDGPAVAMIEYTHFALKSLAELVVYVGMMAIALWIFLQSPGGNLSAALKVLLVLSSIFFASCLFLHISQTSDNVMQRNVSTELLRDTGATPLLKAAVETAMFCPMICVLFCSMHLRALELSDYKGQPQLWVQSCMYLCMMACCMQLGMVFVTGIIVGEPHEVKTKSTESMYSTFTAKEQSEMSAGRASLAAICGQYISMACIFASTAAVIGGVFFATPSNTA